MAINRPSESKAMSRKVSVLFVDDEPNILRAVRRHLRHYKDEWHIHFAYGGVDAVKVITRENVDIIVTDMRMPEVDGSQLLEWISENHPEIIRIVLSGEAKLEEIYRIVGRSHRFLAKPSSPEATISVIRDVVDAQLHDQIENGVFEMSMLDRLGTPASIFNTLQGVLDADEVRIDEIANIVQQDPSLSLRSLQICNSAYFKQASHTCDIRKAISTIGADRFRELLKAGRLGQDSRVQVEDDKVQQEAYWLARASKNECTAQTDSQNVLSAAYVLGLGLRCGAVDTSGTLSQVAKRAAFLTVLFGLPEILPKSLLSLAKSNASAPFEHWPKLIANAVIEQNDQLLNE
ncbi:MAG: response regulator, partial [Nisaea sp.]